MKRVRLSVSLLISVVAIAWLARGLPSLRRRAQVQAAAYASAVPIHVEPLVPPGFSDAVGDALPAPEELQLNLLNFGGAKVGASHLIHLLRLAPAGIRWPCAGLSSPAELVRLFTDSDAGAAYLGIPTLVRTRTGLCSDVLLDGRSPSRVGKESHRDQLLCVFAEIGMPLNQPLVVDHLRYSLKDMLSDSLLNFTVHQAELEWSVAAYAHYLPPETKWVNKFGVGCSFEEVARAMLTRPFGASCAGTHTLQTLTLLLRIDEGDARLLSEPTRKRVRTFLSDALKRTVSSQHDDGAWSRDWYKGRTAVFRDATAASSRLLVTSHLAEWMLYLPEGLSPPPSVLARACRWLAHELKIAGPQAVYADPCPYSHALLVFGLAASDSSAVPSNCSGSLRANHSYKGR